MTGYSNGKRWLVGELLTNINVSFAIVRKNWMPWVQCSKYLAIRWEREVSQTPKPELQLPARFTYSFNEAT